MMRQTGFGRTADGREAQLYTFTNDSGMQMQICDYGAHLVSLLVPDRDGRLVDVVLGYGDVSGYETDGCHFGATIGRNGNRIAGASFSLHGRTWELAANENGNSLHSGPDGYEYRYWEVKELTECSITLGIVSPDGDQGFPGNFTVCVTYTLTGENAVEILYEGLSDADTVVNMTNHSYFNLAGHDSGDVLAQTLYLNAEHYSPVRDAGSIPTGEHAPVAGTPMDFTTERAIGERIEADFEQLAFTGGYDHNFLLDQAIPGSVELMARAHSEATGILMEAYTDLPAVQFYAGNYIRHEAGKGGAVYEKRAGFCLESQFVPDAIHNPAEEQPVLLAGDTYETTTVYQFSVR